MAKKHTYFLSVVSIIIGAIFIYSAYTKLYTLEAFQSFEFTIIEYIRFPWWMATLASRLLTGIELALGILIALHFYGNLKWILKLANGLLIVFSIYLVYLWIVAGNDINCGCFGDEVFMSPASSLIKNVILFAGIWLLIRYQSGLQIRWAHTLSPILLFAISALPFFFHPLPDAEPQWLNKQQSFKLDLAALYKPGRSDMPKTDLYKGKYIIAFFSFSCPHCQMAAYKMHLMKQRNPSLPFYFVVAGKEQNEPLFWEKTKAKYIPHTKLESKEFTDIIGYSFPVIYWVNNGWVEADNNYLELDQGKIEDWLEKK